MLGAVFSIHAFGRCAAKLPVWLQTGPDERQDKGRLKKSLGTVNLAPKPCKARRDNVGPMLTTGLISGQRFGAYLGLGVAGVEGEGGQQESGEAAGHVGGQGMGLGLKRVGDGSQGLARRSVVFPLYSRYIPVIFPLYTRGCRCGFTWSPAGRWARSGWDASADYMFLQVLSFQPSDARAGGPRALPVTAVRACGSAAPTERLNLPNWASQAQVRAAGPAGVFGLTPTAPAVTIGLQSRKDAE